MRYVKARFEIENRAEMYRIFVTDCLKSLSGTSERYYDWIDNTPADSRTAEEIISEITSNIGKKGG